MSASYLLEQVAAHGGHVRVEGTTLKLRAPSPLPDDLVAALRREKPALIRMLTRRTVWRVARGGREICTLICPRGADRAEATAAARFHWPDATVVPYHSGAERKR